MAEKILIVDDDLDTLKLVGLILQRQGYQIVAANSGSQGLAKAAAERPNLILLDVMMPDMEGYEVARRLRADRDLAQTPIIMFTAKTLVDDKVAGFEAGVDDYMTKPTHPAELVSRVKALLARAAATQRSTGPLERGKIIGIFAPKGGLGATTFALNFGTAMAQGGNDVILCDLRPGQGTLGLQLGFSHSNAVEQVLAKPAGEISNKLIEGQLVSHANTGLRLLLSSASPNNVSLANAVAQAEQLVRKAATMTKYLVLDMGPGVPDMVRKIIPLCDRHLLIIEPMRVTITLAKEMFGEFEKLSISPSRVDVLLLNRERSSLQMSWQQVEGILNHSIASVMTAAPELAYQAGEAGVPMVLMQPQSLTADQARTLAELITQKNKPIPPKA